MITNKRITPFADGVEFKDTTTLLMAFEQKALAEGWTKEEIKDVRIEASRGGFQQALSTVLEYVEISDVYQDSDDNEFSIFSDEGEDDNGELDGHQLHDTSPDYDFDGPPDDVYKD
jgi:hypothetical protein